MNDPIIDRFCDIYQTLNKNNLDKLTIIYDEKVIFIDAAHQVKGLDALHTYFSHLYENLSYCHFAIEQVICQEGQASIIWTMIFSHKKLNSGKEVKVNGCSHLKFNKKIYYHRDYLDMGQMVYEQIPILGGIIKWIKKQGS